jgi:hypothetical protein
VIAMPPDGAPFGKVVNAIPAHARVDLRSPETKVYGDGYEVHPITRMPLERGFGALSPYQQALMHCDVIQQREGNLAADIMRARLKAHREAQVEAHEAAIKEAVQQEQNL